MSKRTPSAQSFFIERFATPTGTMLLVTDPQDRVRALDWEDHEARLHRLLDRHYGPGATRLEAAARASNAGRVVQAYFAGERSAIAALAVQTGGTAFQRGVWTALRAIPLGEITTYGRIALAIGRPKAVRAVGLANGANPVALVVPCHRVIGSDASLTGYGGGIERKRWLLEHEGARLPLRRAARSQAALPAAFAYA
jgi:methylated-DNA-[protein]-cysteine S-methyltransferase